MWSAAVRQRNNPSQNQYQKSQPSRGPTSQQPHVPQQPQQPPHVPQQPPHVPQQPQQQPIEIQTQSLNDEPSMESNKDIIESTNNNSKKDVIESKELEQEGIQSTNVNNKIFFGTRYEVKCEETFAYYEGYVFDYDEKENKLKVSYPFQWKSDQSVPINFVRPIASGTAKNWRPKQGDHVECKAKAEDSEPFGWWDCTIKTVKDNLYLITYEGWDNHHQVLGHNMLRPYNDQQSCKDDRLICEYIICEEVDSMEQLKKIRLQTELIHLNYCINDEKKIILIGTEQQINDAKMLIFQMLFYKKKEEEIANEEKTKQKEYNELKNCALVKFQFNVNLTRYIIGPKGKNIQIATDINDNIKHINIRNINDTISECSILATDINAAREARNILEIQQDYELIPKSVRKELIGKDGLEIQKLEERSKVIKICTLDYLDYRDPTNQALNDPTKIKLIIIGRKEKISFAKMLIQQQVESIQRKRSFVERKAINSRHYYINQQKEQQTQRSNKDTGDFDYTNNNKSELHSPKSPKLPKILKSNDRKYKLRRVSTKYEPNLVDMTRKPKYKILSPPRYNNKRPLNSPKNSNMSSEYRTERSNELLVRGFVREEVLMTGLSARSKGGFKARRIPSQSVSPKSKIKSRSKLPSQQSQQSQPQASQLPSKSRSPSKLPSRQPQASQLPSKLPTQPSNLRSQSTSTLPSKSASKLAPKRQKLSRTSSSSSLDKNMNEHTKKYLALRNQPINLRHAIIPTKNKKNLHEVASIKSSLAKKIAHQKNDYYCIPSKKLTSKSNADSFNPYPNPVPNNRNINMPQLAQLSQQLSSQSLQNLQPLSSQPLSLQPLTSQVSHTHTQTQPLGKPLPLQPLTSQTKLTSEIYAPFIRNGGAGTGSSTTNMTPNNMKYSPSPILNNILYYPVTPVRSKARPRASSFYTPPKNVYSPSKQSPPKYSDHYSGSTRSSTSNNSPYNTGYSHSYSVKSYSSRSRSRPRGGGRGRGRGRSYNYNTSPSSRTPKRRNNKYENDINTPYDSIRNELNNKYENESEQSMSQPPSWSSSAWNDINNENAQINKFKREKKKKKNKKTVVQMGFRERHWSQWGGADVLNWIKYQNQTGNENEKGGIKLSDDVNLYAVAQNMKEQGICGVVLLQLKMENWKDLGVTIENDRKQIHDKIQELIKNDPQKE